MECLIKRQMGRAKQIEVKGTLINLSLKDSDYICITDMANAKDGSGRAADIIKNWIRTRSTLEFIGTWEQLYNPDFKVVEFDHFKMQAGLPSFVLSPSKLVDTTNAKGIFTKKGKYGGTYAHKDIAFEFGSAISPVFKLFLIKEFQRLKDDESNRLQLEWNLQRAISKINYRIHTDAIRENLIPEIISKTQTNFVYANEADLLNVALFGTTAKEWKETNPNEKGNMRDDANIEQLIVLSNMESINALLIKQNLSQKERLTQLNTVAITQMKSLLTNNLLKSLEKK